MATATAATFQPNNFAGAPGAAGNATGGALATSGTGNALMGADGAPLPAPGVFAPVQQMLMQPGVKKAMPFILMGLALLLFVMTTLMVLPWSQRTMLRNKSLIVLLIAYRNWVPLT